MTVDEALDYQMKHCCFCDSTKSDRKYMFISNAQPVIICDMCVGALNVQMFHIELQQRHLEDPRVKQ